MQNQKKFEKKDEKKTRRRHFFKNLGAIFCAILVIMAFIFESYGPYSKKSSPSQQCKQTKNLFLSFLNYLSLLYGGLFQNETSQITSSNMLVSRIRKTVVRRQDNKSFNISTHHFFQENHVFSYLIIPPHTFCKNWDR